MTEGTHDFLCNLLAPVRWITGRTRVPHLVLAYNHPMSERSGLPNRFRLFFWDYPFARLSLVKDRDLIIRRLLSNGSWDAVRWLRREVGDEQLREWLISHQGRGLSARQLRFWGVLFDLPSRQVNQWVRTVQNGVWGNR